MKLTAKMLGKGSYCRDKQVAAFKEEWPDGVELTETTCRRAMELGLNLYMFGIHSLSGVASDVFKSLTNQAEEERSIAYEKATKEIDEVYFKAEIKALLRAWELEEEFRKQESMGRR